MRPDPKHNIHPSAVPAWRISDGLLSLPWLTIPGFIVFMYIYDDWPLWMAISSSCIVLCYITLLVTYIPKIRWRHWRYQIDEHEIYLKYGIFVIRRVLIPVARIQNVDTRQGPVYRHFNLSSVTITTAATTHEIPALDEQTADEVRNLISRYAREADADV